MAKIAILSGKGGTGKTFVATNLARIAGKCTYLDCDVEEPNGNIFLNGPITKTCDVTVKIPMVDKKKCDGCRECVSFCQFNALAYLYDRILVFKNICHNCGGCALVCPNDAISYENIKVGEVTIGQYLDTMVVTGTMKVGTESAVSTVATTLENAQPGLNIIDCPPGTACSVMEAIEDASYCIIVVEPTLFSYHNYLMVKELLEKLKLPYGLVVNKDMESTVEYTDNVIARIPYQKEIGMLVASGKLAVEHSDEYKGIFMDILDTLRREANV